jgi:hypothetical protein
VPVGACSPGSKVTLALLTRAGSGAWNSGSMRTAPVKYSAEAVRDGCEPLRLISNCGVLGGRSSLPPSLCPP